MDGESTSLRIIACPECGAPAEVIDEGQVPSTDGPIGLARVRCVGRHWFLMPADRLADPDEPIVPSRTLG
jgi:hypothetical protein